MIESLGTVPGEIKPRGLDIIEGIVNRLKTEFLRPQLKEAAKNIAEGKAALFPGRGVYVILLDGNNAETVETVRKIKKRRPDQREATVVPPQKLFELVDFPLAQELNPQITKINIMSLYNAHPVGLILPCLENKVPEHLITYHEINGRKIPSILNVWPSNYRIYSMFWREISQYPEVLTVGSSANPDSLLSPHLFEEARFHFAGYMSSNLVASAIKDPNEDRHFYKGSHSILNLLRYPSRLHRRGNVDPDKHPEQFKKFTNILPGLKTS